MKPTGIVRRLDSLGRIVIPTELRRRFRIDAQDCVEFYVEGDGIVLKKYDTTGDLEEHLENTEKWIRQEDGLPQEKMHAILTKVEEMKDIIRSA